MNHHLRTVKRAGSLMNINVMKLLMQSALIQKGLDGEGGQQTRKLSDYSSFDDRQFLNLKIIERVKFDLLNILHAKNNQDYSDLIVNFGIDFTITLPLKNLTKENIWNILLTSEDEDEPTIEESVLEVISSLTLDIRNEIVGNTIICGGSAMLPGFQKYIRLLIQKELEHNHRFCSLQKLKDKFQYADNIFPSNCLGWIGASLISSVQEAKWIDEISNVDYLENKKLIPDWSRLSLKES